MDEPLAFWNGAFLPQARAAVPLHDAGFAMGATVTDLVRTVDHRLYRFPDHLARFRQSCRATGIFPTIAEQEVVTRAEELVAHNAALVSADQELALVLLATPGPMGYYLGQEGTGPPTFGMHTFPLPYLRYRRYFFEGVRLVVPSVRHLPAECVDPRIKQRSRLFWWLADQEAQRIERGASALLLDQAGCITETAHGNVLVVKDRVVQSPPRDRILNGVSLHIVEELCAEVGLRFVERPLRLYDCLNADEMLHTCATYCLAGVSKVNGSPLPFPGPVLKRLGDAWSVELGLDFRRQILPQ